MQILFTKPLDSSKKSFVISGGGEEHDLMRPRTTSLKFDFSKIYHFQLIYKQSYHMAYFQGNSSYQLSFDTASAVLNLECDFERPRTTSNDLSKVRFYT